MPDEERHEVRRPRRQRRAGRGRNRPAGLDDPRLEDTNGNGRLDAAEAVTRRRARDGRERRLLDDVPDRALRCLRGPAGRLDSVLPERRPDCSAGTGLAPRGWAINLPSVQDDGNDFGNYQQATKTGVKFEDPNANGVKDAGEAGLTGWTINAYSTRTATASADVAENTMSATTRPVRAARTRSASSRASTSSARRSRPAGSQSIPASAASAPARAAGGSRSRRASSTRTTTSATSGRRPRRASSSRT